MESKKKGISGFAITMWIFVFFAIVCNLTATGYYNKGYITDGDSYRSIATICWVIAGVFAFLWIVVKISRANTNEQQVQIEEQKKKIDELQLQSEKIIELQKQIEDLKK